mmetsp:Transcript_41192/g.129395  ORF Transcript_41192/g.129395 Transcript_41192/m.129395 type:complete len:212 (-) Transcript_41192:80-715(-)
MADDASGSMTADCCSQRLSKLPRVVWGHSMGGLVATHVILDSSKYAAQWKALMLTGPALEVDPKAASPFAQFLARTLSNLVPKFAVPWERGPARKFPLSHDDKLNEAFHSDPLVYHGGLRVRWGAEMLTAIARAQDDAGSISLPYILFHGSADHITNPDGSERFHKNTSSSSKEFVPIEGGYHELHNELPQYRDPFMKRSSEWLLSIANRG